MMQSPFLSAAAVGTVAVALTLMAFFALIVLNVQQMTRNLSQDLQIIAYLEGNPQGDGREKLLENIRSMAEVDTVIFVSKAEAFARFSKRLGQDATLLEGMDSEVLPASVEITLKDNFRTRSGVDQVLTQLKGKGVFSDFRYGQEWLERFESFVALLRLAGAILGGFLLFATLFIVSNTIKLTIYARRDELEVMALVGATPLFIKGPFLLEGALQGAAGGLFALIGAFGIFQLFMEKSLSFMLMGQSQGGLMFLPASYQWAMIGAGTFLGFMGSLVSLRQLVRI